MSGTTKASAAGRELADAMCPDLKPDDLETMAGIVDSHLEPLLRALNKTIEFYDAHGGPMGDLRKEAEKWKPGR